MSLFVNYFNCYLCGKLRLLRNKSSNSPTNPIQRPHSINKDNSAMRRTASSFHYSVDKYVCYAPLPMFAIMLQSRGKRRRWSLVSAETECMNK